MKKTLVSTPQSVFEEQIGFSRAIRLGNVICVSGTAPIAEDGSVACPGDLYGQTKRCLEIIKSSVEKAGGHWAQIIRTRIYLTDITRWAEAASAHREYFSDIKPASTFIEVSGLINNEWLVEIEADCIAEG